MADYTTKYEGDLRIYSIWKNCLEIPSTFLFKKLRGMGCDFASFTFDNDCINLYGAYDHSRVTEIKRFFYDIYPMVAKVEPRKFGVTIYFKTKISLINNNRL